MSPEFVTALIGAATAGAITSVHCVGMCGPLSCAILSGAGGQPRTAMALYHAGRLVSYAAIGGILGTLGRSASSLFTAKISQALPWAVAVLFLVLALGLETKVPKPRFFGGLLLKLKLSGHGASRSSALLGLLSPFLPCAPLYLAFGVALFAGSFLKGAALMAVFAGATIPLYALAQLGYLRIQNRLSPTALKWIRQGFALVAASLVIWRALANEGLGLESPSCPLCH